MKMQKSILVASILLGGLFLLNASRVEAQTVNLVANLSFHVIGGTATAAACTTPQGALSGSCAFTVAAWLTQDERYARFFQNGCEFVVEKLRLGDNVQCTVKIIGPADLANKALSEVTSLIEF